jgi:hypothetical protein
MNKFSGIDLHSNNSVVLVSDETDRVMYAQRLPNELPAILQALATSAHPSGVWCATWRAAPSRGEPPDLS